MKIELARIDDRFIHGQVLTKWVKLRPIDRIIIVSDSVAADEMRKTLVLSVAPANVAASAVSVDKMIRAYKSPRYATTTAIFPPVPSRLSRRHRAAHAPTGSW